MLPIQLLILICHMPTEKTMLIAFKAPLENAFVMQLFATMVLSSVHIAITFFAHIRT